MTLLLASQSAARRSMLEASAIPFETVSPRLDEESLKRELVASGLDPVAISSRLALAKAASVEAPAGAFIIGADQLLEKGDSTLLSKPRSRDEARAQLQDLRACTHKLHSSAVLYQDGETLWSGSETAILRMREFSAEFLETYLDREYEAIRWNVGAYRIEAMGIQLFDRVEGSHFAMIGLPLLPLIAALRRFGLVAH